MNVNLLPAVKAVGRILWILRPTLGANHELSSCIRLQFSLAAGYSVLPLVELSLKVVPRNEVDVRRPWLSILWG
jgi:hypothetical protein